MISGTQVIQSIIFKTKICRRNCRNLRFGNKNTKANKKKKLQKKFSCVKLDDIVHINSYSKLAQDTFG